MTELDIKGLLPAGLRDILPPEAAFEASIRETLISMFGGYGYERVKPPLLEFENGLISGTGTAMSEDIFRLMDPVSQQMMGIRADMTTQVARIATTRLYEEPRPVRLSYTGEVLRVRGTQLRPERQFAQVGAELIGVESAAADVEIISIAVEALNSIGISNLSIDLTIPPLVPSLLSATSINDAMYNELRAAIDRKDTSAVEEAGGIHSNKIIRLMEGTGPAEEALKILEDISLPQGPAGDLGRLKAVVQGLKREIPSLEITVDPVESRGFEYHKGVAFAFFSKGERGEIGTGGRYAVSVNGMDSEDQCGEAATGFTLFVDNILRVLPDPKVPSRIFIPLGSDKKELSGLREKGWVTIFSLDQIADHETEAKRLNCSHLWVNGEVIPIKERVS
tara:strand:- start:659 stop:1837 length:1179 start_codon:yes stop_codon:yes gene_type:complete